MNRYAFGVSAISGTLWFINCVCALQPYVNLLHWCAYHYNYRHAAHECKIIRNNQLFVHGKFEQGHFWATTIAAIIACSRWMILTIVTTEYRVTIFLTSVSRAFLDNIECQCFRKMQDVPRSTLRSSPSSSVDSPTDRPKLSSIILPTASYAANLRIAIFRMWSVTRVSFIWTISLVTSFLWTCEQCRKYKNLMHYIHTQFWKDNGNMLFAYMAVSATSACAI